MTFTTARVRVIDVTTPHAPTEWALLERALLKAETEACEQFFERYFDMRGYLRCVARWSTNDGPDDAIENLLNSTLLHALGGGGSLIEMFEKAWEAHFIQYTDAKTETVAFGRDGIYYKEFPEYFDWFHIGEWLNPFVLQTLSDPRDPALIRRMKKFAGLYMDEDPQAKNYDPDKRLIRSMWGGSRGPLLRDTTRLDWAGDPVEIEGRFTPGHGERTNEEMLAHFDDYVHVRGDHPLNLGATTLGVMAYTLTGEEKYYNWVTEYVDAWVERTKANGGIVPSNVGLDGRPGGELGGRWYGGVYGWAFTVVVPQTGQLADRPVFLWRSYYGFANALLLTGNLDYVKTWADMIAQVNANAKVENGQTLYPHMYGEDGWYRFTPEPFDRGVLECYYWTMDKRLLQWTPQDRWLDFLAGKDDAFPVEALKSDFSELRRRMEQVRADDRTPDCMMSDDVHHILPGLTDSLIQLMLGGLPTGRVGYPLHCRLRYFDPDRRRAGLPDDVGALVDSMTEDEVSVTLLNLSPVATKTVIVQGGAYAEHQFVSIASNAGELSVDHSHFVVRLAPGSGERLTIRMKRYANRPTSALPWA